MSRAYPYLRPPPDVMRTGPWARTVADGSAELSDELSDWDYNTVLGLHRQVRVDGARVRAASGLGDDADVRLTVRWTATASFLRGHAWQAPVPPHDVELTVSFDLPGHELGGTLELETVLTVADPGTAPSGLAARVAGSILWSDRFAIDLQSDRTQFPMAVADFADLHYPVTADWHLEVDQDLDAPALGSILLVVNERSAKLTGALAAAAAPGEADEVVLSMLRADLLRRLVEHAVTDESFDPDRPYPPGTTGAVLQAVLGRHFADVDLESLRRERENDPAQFATRVQAAAAPLGCGG